ncbi:hypothetical protein GCM10010340_35010 [Streptomyces griseoloalbus]|nr:hypothetical protein GCM10010340_35010 [Streptomyces albaduncus]
MDHAELLLIGGWAGVGKTTVGWEVSALLRAAAVSHAVIDGDFMGQVHPAPEGILTARRSPRPTSPLCGPTPPGAATAD